MARALLMAFTACLLANVQPQTVRAGDLELGEYLSSQCTTCHQRSGKSNGIPPIVGWDAQSFVAVMQSYKDKERENKVMRNIAGSLSAEEIAALAAYFATLKLPEEKNN